MGDFNQLNGAMIWNVGGNMIYIYIYHVDMFGWYLSGTMGRIWWESPSQDDKIGMLAFDYYCRIGVWWI